MDPSPRSPRASRDVVHTAVDAAAQVLAAARHGRPPHDFDAERAVLGGVLLDNRALIAIEPVVTAGDFYDPRHGTLYEAMQALGAMRAPIDIVTLAAELRARQRLHTIGGAQYLDELTDTVPSISHIEAHARIVADLGMRRRMVYAAQEIVTRGMTEEGTIDAFLEFASAAVFEVARHRAQGTLVPLEAAIIEAYERLERATREGVRVTGIPTGFRDLDTLTAGMHNGQLIIIAARPAMGKTSFAMGLALNAVRAIQKPVLVFSLEMPRLELTNRMLCAEARVDLSRLRANLVTQDDLNALTQAANLLHQQPIFLDDSGDLTLLELRAKARRLKTERGLGLIVIDYLQLMRASRERAESREREVAEISRSLKALAKELDVPIVALSQLNRGCETRPGKNKRPMLSDLRESGAIEQDADVVMFLYRDEVYNRDTEDKGVAELILAKQRNGPTDTVRLRFVRALTRFENLAQDQNVFPDATVNGAEEPVDGYDSF